MGCCGADGAGADAVSDYFLRDGQVEHIGHAGVTACDHDGELVVGLGREAAFDGHGLSLAVFQSLHICYVFGC